MASAPAVIVNLPGYPFENFPSLSTIAALRAVSPTGLMPGANYVVDGSAAAGDGGGGVFAWNAASLAADDGALVVKPSALTTGQAGRWLLTGNTSIAARIFTSLADTAGAALIGYKNPAASALSRTVASKLAESISVKDFGALGNGTSDDTALIQAAINYAAALSRAPRVYFPAGSYKLTSPLIVPPSSSLTLFGDGELSSMLFATTNFDCLVQLGTGVGVANYTGAEGLSFSTIGTTTKCVFLHYNTSACVFRRCQFYGDLSGDLVYSQAQNAPLFDSCNFYPNAAGTWGLNLDSNNLNARVTDCSFGPGVGNGLRTTSTGTQPVEGLRVSATHFTNTGANNIALGNSLLTIISGCVLDQATGTSLVIGVSARGVTVTGCWVGGNPAYLTTGIRLIAAAGRDHIITSNQFQFLQYGVAAEANPSARVDGLVISNNVFDNIHNVSITLDSVAHCVVTGNIDNSLGTTGFTASWITTNTFAASGSYLFDDNFWAAAVPPFYDTTSVYRFGNDLGIQGRSRGASSPGSSATTLAINHNLFRVPSNVLVSAEGVVGDLSVVAGSITNTGFNVQWTTAGTPKIHWQAEI